jgi:ataxia telangiectasia mutated family protein
LCIRTYKIVPTTPQTGVLQWVENTLPFGGILVGKDVGLHSRYFPKDWSPSECRNNLKDATDNEDRLRRFKEIYGNNRISNRFLYRRYFYCRFFM